MYVAEKMMEVTILAVFFILPRVTWANQGIYLVVLFSQPGKKNWAKMGKFFTRVVKKNG